MAAKGRPARKATAEVVNDHELPVHPVAGIDPANVREKVRGSQRRHRRTRSARADLDLSG